MDFLADLAAAFQRTQELRDSWQGRMLAHAKGKNAMVLLSVIADNYEQITLPLLHAFGRIEPPLPCLISSGRVAKSGAVFAKVMFENGSTEFLVFYRSEIELRDNFRRLADRGKLSDLERIEMFAALRRWIVADFRLDPNMDPQDPDARRLVH